MKDVSDVYLTPEQVAAKLDLNVETIYRWLRTRKIRASRISQKAWRIPERELASFIRRRNVSELLFEEYAEEYKLGRLEYEPTFPGSTRRVDYRIAHPKYPLWFEVKEFDDDPTLSGSGGGGSIHTSESERRSRRPRRNSAITMMNAVPSCCSTSG